MRIGKETKWKKRRKVSKQRKEMETDKEQRRKRIRN